MNNGEDVGFIRSLVDGDLDGFRQEFESFLDRCQPFPSYVGMGRFLSVFFSSVFITARFAGIISKNERVYIRFDNHDVVPGNADLEIGQRKTGNLKVAVLTDQLKGEKRIVRYYTISNRWNSEGSRFSEIEKAAVERRIVGQNQGLEGNLDSEEYRISVQGYASTQGERGAITVQNLTGDGFTGYSASEFAYYRRELGMHLTTNGIREGIARNLQPPGRNIAREYFENNINFTEFAAPDEIINNPIENLANADIDAVSQQYIDIILDRATQFYNQHREISGFNISGAKREFEDRGFWLGVLATFSYHYTVDIDLSPVNSCVTFLVRRQAERRNVPIVVNLSTEGADGALSKARGYAKRLHSSSYISIHTESEHAVCVGLNLNQATFSVDTVEFLKNRLHFVEKLFKRVQDRQNREIQEETRNFLLHHLPREIPIDAGNLNRRFDYMTGFAFGSSAFDIRPVQLEGSDEAYVTRYIFRYGNENLRRSVLTMVFHAQGSDIVILHIRTSNDIQLGAIALPRDHIAAVGVVTYTLNDRSGINSNAVRFNTPGDYLRGNRGNLLDGQLVEISNAENVHDALNQVMNNDWQDRDQHGEFFKAISRVLMPMNGNAIIDVDSWDKFLSILHGVSYTCENPGKVLSRYKADQTHGIQREVRTRVTEQGLDLLLLRRTEENDSDTHPIGYVLELAGNVEEAKRRINELMGRRRGYLSITTGNEVVLACAIFNAGAQRAEDLITIQQLYVRRFDRDDALRRVEPQQPVRLVEPGSIIDENPPEVRLSDPTHENLINYIRENPGWKRILPFDLGDKGNMQQLLEILRSRTRVGSAPTEEGILERINNVLGDNNSIQDVNDLITLDFATDNGYYRYWLQQHDISYAARAIGYNFPVGDEMRFHLMGITNGQVDVLKTHIRHFKNGGGVEPRRSTLIVNLGGNHWVTLVIDYRNRNYIGYYADSFGTGIRDDIREALESNGVSVRDISVLQQRDGHNCGFWALENARDINQVLNENPGGRIEDIADAIKERLRGDDLNRDENYFQTLRVEVSRELRDLSTDTGRARYITTDADGHANLNGAMVFIINNQNQTVIRNLLLEYLASLRLQLSHFNKEQQAALLQFVSSSFPNASIELVKQGLYLPSFEKRGVNVNGKCVAITRNLSQALSLHKEKSFLNTLKTSTEIYERIAQGKQISKREEKEAFTFSKLLSNFEEQADCVTSTLPSSLTHSRSCKMLSDLSNYIAKINGDFALHLVTSNHVVAIYRMSDNYAYFDSNAAFVSELKSVDQLIQVVEKGIGFASYEIGEKGFLIEHFDVNQANDLLDDEDKQTLTREIKTERELLAEQDKELGLIKIDGQEVSRVQLYDFGTKINVKGSVPLLINADMKLNSEKFLDYLDKKEVSITAREYLDNLQNSKNVKEVVQATKAIPFEGSNREVKEAEHQRSQELKFSMKQLIKYLLTAVIRQKSQLSEDNSKADDNPNHYLSSVTISSKPKESQRY